MLALQGIHAGYGAHRVLRGVDVVVPDGAVVALLGPNGAGKTTLLRVASGLLAPGRGTVTLDGRDATATSTDRRSRAGLCHVPEGRGVFPHLTVEENLRLQLPPGAPRGEIDLALEAFPRLAERADQRAGTMSGGEQQMLALARAFVGRPRVVLLDEVSMGLAPRLVDEIFEHLARLATTGTSLLLVEQYVERALALADYAYVLRKGAIDFVGEPGELGDDDILASYLGVAS